MKKILIIALLFMVSIAFADKVKPIKLSPMNSNKTMKVFNKKTKKSKDYYVCNIDNPLEFKVNDNCEIYGFVRTYASNNCEPELNVFLNDTLMQILSVSVDKSIKYTLTDGTNLSRAKLSVICSKSKEGIIKFTTTSKDPLLLVLYAKKNETVIEG